MADNMKRLAAISLSDMRCCARCILRFLGERNCCVFSEPIQTLSKTLSRDLSSVSGGKVMNDFVNESSNGSTTNDACSDADLKMISNATKSDGSPCVSCLGILEEGFENEVVEKVYGAIEKSGHEFDSFALSVTLPFSILVREHSIWLFLQEKYRSLYDSCKISQFVPSVKDVLKWVCGPTLEKTLGVPFQPLSPFQVAITFECEGSARELDFLSEAEPSLFQKRKLQKRDPQMPSITISKIQKTLQTLPTAEEFRKFSHCPPKLSLNKCQCAEVLCFHGQVFLAGRYNKYSRVLPQSPWIVDDKRHAESSVQEKICEPVVLELKGDDYKFSSAGREDVDVRMLGRGRPFIVEVINPKVIHHSSTSLRELQDSINTSCPDIGLRDLQIVTREDCGILKEAELNKTKSYSALIWTAKEIKEEDLQVLQQVKDLKLFQKTPLRVLHRRTLAVRERHIHSMETEWIDSHHFRLFLKTQAGTYIKEFVHSDFGRTEPSLGTLLHTETDILELDVESVDVNWPPAIDEDS